MIPFWPLFLAAVVAGFVGALDGIGGAVVLVPILTMAGVDIREAIAIGSISAVSISNSAAPNFLRRHLPNLKLGGVLELFAIVGAIIGSVLTGMTSRHFLFLFCGISLIISWFALWRAWRIKPHLTAMEDAALYKQTMLVGSYYDSEIGKTVVYEGRHPYWGSLCMFGVGLMGGLLGGGSSVFTVLVIDLVIGFPTKVALTMSNLMMGTVALASLSIYLEKGLIDAKWMIPTVLGTSIGAMLGSRLLWQLKGRVVRSIFLCVLIVLGLEMIYNGQVLSR